MSKIQEIPIEEFVRVLWWETGDDGIRIFSRDQQYDQYTQFACTVQKVAGHLTFIANAKCAPKPFCYSVPIEGTNEPEGLVQAFRKYLSEMGFGETLWYDDDKVSYIPYKASYLTMHNTTFANHIFTLVNRSKFEFKRDRSDEEKFVIRRLAIAGRTLLVCNSSKGDELFQCELTPENRAEVYKDFLAYMKKHRFDYVCVRCG